MRQLHPPVPGQVLPRGQFPMRRFVALRRALLWLLVACPSMANAAVVPVNTFSVEFGTPQDLAAPCTEVGPGADRDCSRSISVDNGARDATAKFAVSAQASADTGLSYGSLIASATNDVHYQIPFVVTRDVNVARVGDQYVAVAPELSLTFDYRYGAVAATRDETGTGSERADLGQLTLTLSDSTPWVVGPRGQSGQSGQLNRNVAEASSSRSITLGLGASAGEVGQIAEIPLSMSMWSDELPPFVDYSVNSQFVQTYWGTLAVEVSLSARSQATQDCIDVLGVTICTEGNGGEALACFGVGSNLGGFAIDELGCPVGFSLDLSPLDSGGLTVSAALSQTGIGLERIGPVPLPASLPLVLSAFGAVVFRARRRRD